MKNVFISYAREDRDTAHELADALAKRGYKVWWDWNLVGGENFRDKIHEQLQSADKVIAIWSPTSVKSPFVIDEVAMARRAEKLIPTQIDDAQPPFGFGDLHTLPLSTDAADIDAIAAAIENKTAPLAPRPWYRKVRPLPWLVGLAVAGAAAAALMPVASPYVMNPRTYVLPRTATGVRIDHCLHWAQQCGEPAATFWCKTQGYSRSTAHGIEGNVPPTFVVGDSRICDGPGCTAFKIVTCER